MGSFRFGWTSNAPGQCSDRRRQDIDGEKNRQSLRETLRFEEGEGDHDCHHEERWRGPRATEVEVFERAIRKTGYHQK
jgi:hypothetical protein